MVSGFLLSLILGAAAYHLVPPQYTSSGTLVLVQPKRATNMANPFLTFNDSLNTTTLIVVQALNAPKTAMELGLVDGRDAFTAKNWGDVSLRDYGVQQPFVTVTAQSSTPAQSMTIVSLVLNRARQEVANLQSSARVPTRNAIRVDDIVEPASADPVRAAQARVVLAVVLLGLAITTLVAWAYHVVSLRVYGRESRRGVAPDLAEVDRAADRTPAAGVLTYQANGAVHPLTSPPTLRW
jgi:hypothetical protein